MTTRQFELNRVTSDEFVLSMGPQHPSTHGVLRVIVKLDGEVVKDIDADVGYIHSSIEKICENRKYDQILPYTDRTDYLSAVNNNFAYVLAAEKLLGITLPERAEWMRVMLAEMNRIMSHLLWYSAFGMDVGALTPIWYAFRERENLITLMEEVTGGWLTHHAFRIGGFRADLPKGFAQKTRRFLSDFDEKVDEYVGLLIDNVILTSRTKGVGIIGSAKAVNYGMSGPSLRGSDCAYDIRKNDPYSVYSKVDFSVCTGRNGDTYDRCMVRMNEMRESAKIIAQCLDKMPEGEVMAKVPKVIKPAPGETYARVEGPRGEVGIYMVSDGTEKPYRLKMRSPSFSNLSALREIVIGTKIADLVAIMGSLDLVIPEIDR